eukprot:SAG31_NODE_21760_length_541_cov_1.076923_1_plen_83_part_10
MPTLPATAAAGSSASLEMGMLKWALVVAMIEAAKGQAMGQGASGPVPNLPPGQTKQCSENCPGGEPVDPESELMVYVYDAPGC